jgi:DNA-binding HxlR family transcriptional regulator
MNPLAMTSMRKPPCTTGRPLAVVSASEWLPPVLVVLADRPLHYRQILERVRDQTASDRWGGPPCHLHDSVLARTLRRLTEDGLVTRSETLGVFPPSVRYSPTNAVRELLVAIQPLARWAHDHSGLIADARTHRGQTQ